MNVIRHVYFGEWISLDVSPVNILINDLVQKKYFLVSVTQQNLCISKLDFFPRRVRCVHDDRFGVYFLQQNMKLFSIFCSELSVTGEPS